MVKLICIRAQGVWIWVWARRNPKLLQGADAYEFILVLIANWHCYIDELSQLFLQPDLPLLVFFLSSNIIPVLLDLGTNLSCWEVIFVALCFLLRRVLASIWSRDIVHPYRDRFGS